MTIKNILKENEIPAKILIAVIGVSILILAYGLWTQSQSGSINIDVSKRGAAIFLDEKRVGTANADGQTITLERIRPGEHSVLIYLQGYYPWEKTVRVRTNETTEISMFSVRREITSSYKKTDFPTGKTSELKLLLKTSGKNRKTSFSGDGNVEIRKENNGIFATWLGDTSSLPNFFCSNTECQNSVLLFTSSVDPIDTIDFYPGRNDVVIFSIAETIYAIEIDKRGIQNFQPIYKGGNPKFVISNENSMLYIKDDGSWFGIQM